MHTIGHAVALQASKIEPLRGGVRTYDLRTEDSAGFYAEDTLVLLKIAP
jgi:hypothetical protein